MNSQDNLLGENKRCRKCQQIKSIENFRLEKQRGKLRRHTQCIQCRNEASAKWYAEHKEEEQARRRALRKTPEAAIKRQKRKERYQNDAEYKARQLLNSKRYRSSPENLKKLAIRTREYGKIPHVHMARTLRRRVHEALKSKSKSAKTMELLGCSMSHFLLHIESQFSPGMTWDNYGKKGWEIDHIIPCAVFDLTKPEEQRQCFYWSNMQPLWAIDNNRKGAWVPDYQI